MLSKRMSRPAPAPSPSNSDYVHVDDDVEEKKLPPRPSPAREGLVRQVSSGPRQDSVEVPEVHPFLASLGFDSAEVATLLRQELIQERLGGRHEGSLADYKHQYTTNGAAITTLSNTENSFPLLAVAGGTTVSTRTGNTIAARHCRIHLLFRRVLTGVPTAATYDPTITVVVFRDKIPTTPGTMPTVQGTDANPPASATLLFSQLGASSATAMSLPVRNPITEDAYHVYFYGNYKLDTHAGYNYINTNLGLPAPQNKKVVLDIPLHDVQQKYTSYAATSADTNNLWLMIKADTDYLNMGFTDSVCVVTDCEFYDVQI